MSVTFDGERSRKWKWFSDKLIRVIKMLDIPAKGAKINGFAFKVWKLDGLSGGRVSAPMGLAIVYTTVDGTQILTADSWTASITGRQYLNVLFSGILSGLKNSLINNVSEEDMVAAGFLTVPNTPLATESPFNNEVGGIGDGGTVWHHDAMPDPVVMPMQSSEAFWTAVSGNLFVDRDGDNALDPPYWMAAQETSLTFYSSNGANLGGRRTALTESAAAASAPAKFLAMLPSEPGELRAVQMQGTSYPSHAVGRSCALVHKLSVGSVASSTFELADMIVNLPSGLQDAINSEESSARPAGSYAFATSALSNPTLLHVLDLTNSSPSTLPGNAEGIWFLANPTEAKWRLSFVLNTYGGAVHNINSDQFIGLLDHMAQGSSLDPLANWRDALWTLFQLMPRPNHNYTVPYDSVMFHAEDGDVYVWTRKYNSDTLGNYGGESFNAFKIDNAGVHVTTLAIPAEVTSTDGVRPSITYAGDGLYLCVCEKLEWPVRVHEIHVGSPFTSWESVPVPYDYELVFVRPIRVKPDDIILAGILEDAEGVYYFAFLRYKQGSGSWDKLSKLPVTKPSELLGGAPYLHPDNSNWAISFFGKGEFVLDMNEYLSPPYVLSQMPVGAYADYARGMP